MEFRILGPLEVAHGLEAVDVRGQRRRCVLAFLLVNANRVVTTERLVTAVWPRMPPEHAVSAVRGYVYQLRKAFGPGESRLATRGAAYLLHVGPDELDAIQFERLVVLPAAREPADRTVARLTRALQLWRGPALEEFDDADWARAEAVRLDGLRWSAEEQRVDAELALGHHEAALPRLQAWVMSDPLRERVWGQLILALYRSGRQAEALLTYRRLRELLVGELGLEPSEHLRVLEQAVLRQDPALQAPAAASSRLSTSPSPVALDRPPDGAARTVLVRRRVTMLAAEVVVGKELRAALSPSRLQALHEGAGHVLQEAIAAFDGHVLPRRTGSEGTVRIHGLFGVPLRREDDAQRAALAALRLSTDLEEHARAASGAWPTADGLSLRAAVVVGQVEGGPGMGGLETGAGGVADLIQSAQALLEVAGPGEVLLTAAAARAMAPHAKVTPLRTAVATEAPPATSEPVLRLVGVGATEPAAPGAFLVGRERERLRLARLAEEVARGRGAVVTVIGAPGLGKTRLVAELVRHVEQAPDTADRVDVLEVRCASYGSVAPYGPFAVALAGWVGVEPDDSLARIRARLRARLMTLPDLRVEQTSMLSRLLGTAPDPFFSPRHEEWPDDTPLRALVAWFEGRTAARPLLVVVEDVHAADDESAAVVVRLMELTDRAPVLLVLTARPGTTEPWRTLRRVACEEYAHRTVELVLEPLDDAAARELVDALLPSDVEAVEREEIAVLGEGNPLFLRELSARVGPRAGSARHRSWTLSIASRDLLPPTLENLLMARVDQLTPAARELAVYAATLGRDMPLRVLTALSTGDVASELQELLRAQILRELARTPELTYTFTAALLPDAILTSLDSEARRDVYDRVATAYAALSDLDREGDLETLAELCAHAGRLAEAMEHFSRAAERAAALPAPAHAAQMWRRAAKIADRLDDRPRVIELEARAQRLRVPQD